MFRMKSLRSVEDPVPVPISGGASDAGDDKPDDIYSHFSTFALGGTDGTVQWHHLPQDFLERIDQV